MAADRAAVGETKIGEEQLNWTESYRTEANWNETSRMNV